MCIYTFSYLFNYPFQLLCLPHQVMILLKCVHLAQIFFWINPGTPLLFELYH